ncbi:MAG: hypothetical protein ACI94Y_002368 [Maribacter sp.]|jgi:hypothetical protein
MSTKFRKKLEVQIDEGKDGDRISLAIPLNIHIKTSQR